MTMLALTSFTRTSRYGTGGLTGTALTVASMLRAILFPLVLAIPVLAPAWAHAQPTTANAEADTLFDQGRQLMDAGKFTEACSAFDASQKLSPAVSTLFNQAHCREQNNQLATAYGLFREAERQTRVPVDESAEKLNRVALQRIKALEPRLSKLTISVPTNSRVPGLEVRRGNGAIEAGAWNRALPIDGGKYTITARAAGYIEWTSTIEVSPTGDTKTVDVPALVLAPVEPGVAQARSKRVPLLIAGGALTLLGGALGADLLARSDYDKSTREPDDAKQVSLFESAKTKRYVAQGLAVAGVGAAGVAVWLYLRSGRGERDVAPIARIGKLAVEPVVSTDHAGIQLFRNF